MRKLPLTLANSRCLPLLYELYNFINSLIIGITGYFGSGKTTVGKIFQSLGAHFINADKVVHELYKPGQAGFNQIKKHFGPEIFRKNQTIDRKKLGQIVFKNPAKLKKLESLMHPLVVEKITQIIKNIKKKETLKIIIIESIKFPRQLERLIDKFIIIKTLRPKIIARTKNKYSISTVAYIFKSQRIKKTADFVIVNNCSIKSLKIAVKKVYMELMQSINNS